MSQPKRPATISESGESSNKRGRGNEARPTLNFILNDRELLEAQVELGHHVNRRLQNAHVEEVFKVFDECREKQIVTFDWQRVQDELVSMLTSGRYSELTLPKFSPVINIIARFDRGNLLCTPLVYATNYCTLEVVEMLSRNRYLDWNLCFFHSNDSRGLEHPLVRLFDFKSTLTLHQHENPLLDKLLARVLTNKDLHRRAFFPPSSTTIIHMLTKWTDFERIPNLLPDECLKEMIFPMPVDGDGLTPIHIAVYYDNLKALQFFANKVSKNPEILPPEFFNKGDFDLNTPLHYAAGQLKLHALQFLRAQPFTDPNAQNHRSRAPLHLIFDTPPSSNTIAALKILCGLNPSNHVKIKGTEIDDYGDNALHLLLKHEITEFTLPAMEFLIDQLEIDPNEFENNGLTALHLICLKKKKKREALRLLDYLLKEMPEKAKVPKLNPNMANLASSTPLHVVCRPVQADNFASLVIYKLFEAQTQNLIENVDPNLKDIDGNTCLHLLVMATPLTQFSFDAMKCLFNFGNLDKKIRDRLGNTPAQILMKRKYEQDEGGNFTEKLKPREEWSKWLDAMLDYLSK